MLDLGNGSTLLEEQIDRIRASGVIDEIVLVAGYLIEQIEAKLSMYVRQGVPIRIVYNPFYDVSNNLMSLWLARGEMDADFLIANGDCIFSPEMFRGMAAERNCGIGLCVVEKDAFDADDMKIRVEEELVVEVSKTIAAEESDFESPGLALIRGEKPRRLFVRALDALGRDRRYLNRFWLETFNRLAGDGVAVYPWNMTGAGEWQEVDVHLDVNLLRELLAIRVPAAT